MANWKGSQQSITDLQNLDTTYYPEYVCIYLANENKWYYFNSTDTTTADEKNIITASPQGRWVAINNKGLIEAKDSNQEPQTVPERINELLFFISSGRMFVSTDTSQISDWKEVPLNSVLNGTNNPTSLNVSPQFEGQLFIDKTNKNLYISNDGTTWTQIILNDANKAISNISTNNPSGNPKKAGDFHFNKNTTELYVGVDNQSYIIIPSTQDTKLTLDVSNIVDYTDFNDITDPVDIQVYFAPPFINLDTYDWARYGLSHTVSRNELVYLNNTVELSSNYDLSSFIKQNGIGFYLFLPTQYNDPNYIMCGESSSMNIGLELSNVSNNALAKVYNATETTVGNENVIIDGTTLTGNCHILCVNQMNFSATLNVMPYENLTNGNLK